MTAANAEQLKQFLAETLSPYTDIRRAGMFHIEEMLTFAVFNAVTVVFNVVNFVWFFLHFSLVHS
jgi:hypothetical protein